MILRLLIVKSLKEELAYRIDFIGYLMASLLFFGMQFIFFSQIFNWTNEIGGWNEYDMKFVLFVMIISQLLSNTFISSVQEFFQNVTQGRVDPFLVKPFNLLELIYIRWARPSHTFVAIILLLVVSSYFFPALQKATSNQIILFLITGALGIICHICFFTLLNLLTFLTQRDLPVDYIHSELSRLCFLPPSLLGKNLLGTFLIFLPLIFSSTIPAMIILNNNTDFVVPYIFTTTALVSLTLYGLKRGLSHFDGLGG